MSHTDSAACRCQRCAAIAAGLTPTEADRRRREWTALQMLKHGWIAELVEHDPDSPTGFNLHTHGLLENYAHPDFQIVIPLPDKIGHGLLIILADRVKAGERFAHGQIVDGVLEGMPVKMMHANECGRQVMRVILPDKRGKVDRGEIDEGYGLQYRDLPEEKAHP